MPTPGVAEPALSRLLAATSLGTGTDVVLVPGLAVSRYLQQPQRLLAEHTRPHLLEYPGTGRAADPPRGMPTPGLADDALAVSGWLTSNVEQAVLVGHSYGTQVAAQAARLCPDKVRALVLLSPTVDPAYRTWPDLFTRWLIDARREPPTLARFQRPEQRRAGLRRPLAMARSMLHDDLQTTLDQLNVPTTIARGERDALCRREWAIDLAIGASSGWYDELPDVPHAFPYVLPGLVVDVVLGALERTAA